MTNVQHLLLVRHGETVGNLEQIAHGQTESPLNDRGVQQAQLTAEMLTGWEREYHRVYASPLSRAHDTAIAIGGALDLPVSVHSGLMESHLGDLEGVTYKELDEFGYGKKLIRDDDFTDHNGESPNEVGVRMENALLEIRAMHPDENLIIVSHGGAISTLVARLVGTRPAFGHQYLMRNSAVTELILHDDKAPEVIVLNHYDHLPENLTIDPANSEPHAQRNN